MISSRLPICVLLFTVICAGSIKPAFGQSNETDSNDSLKQVLTHISNDKIRVNVLNEIALNYTRNYPDSAIDYATKARTIAEATRDTNGLCDYYNNMGQAFFTKGNYPQALMHFLMALKLAEAIPKPSGQGAALSNISLIYFEQGNFDLALKYGNAALEVEKKINDSAKIAECYYEIGVIYTKQQKIELALANINAAIECFEKMDNPIHIAECYNNLGLMYKNLGQFSLAIDTLKAGLKLVISTKEPYTLAVFYANLASTYKAQGNFAEAERFANLGVAIATPIGFNEVLVDLYETLTAVYEKSNNINAAHKAYKTYIMLRDSLYNRDNSNKILQQQMLYDFDKKSISDSLRTVAWKKEQQNKLQLQKTYTFAGIAGMLVFIIFLVVSIRNNKLLGKEKQRSDTLLLNILPATIAEELKTQGTSTARHFPHVSVLFTDFVGFTTASERLSPETLVTELHTCFKAFDEIITRNGIEKIKTIGDAYLAVCGLPEPTPNHAERIVQAAIEIRNFMESRYAEMGDNTFKVRIGINTGPVVAGIVGIKKFAYDIWGDTVNTAARMEQNSLPGKINISEPTFQLVKHRFRCEYRGEIAAKNKGMLNMYFVA